MSDATDGSEEATPRDDVDRMNEFRELREHARKIRENAQELDDLAETFRWVAAGGLSIDEDSPERAKKLAEAIRRMAADIEDMDIPDPREVRD